MASRKWVWVMAAALCLTLASGVAFAQDSWSLIDDNFPIGLTWDRSAGVSLDTENNGATTWDDTWALNSVQGEGAEASETDRWGVTSVPLAGSVFYTRPAPRLPGLYTFEFDMTGPPIASLQYALPVGPTSVAQLAPFDCNWILANGSGTLVTTDESAHDMPVARFGDILPGTAGGWAGAYVQELAGRLPLVVAGYPDGTYRPGWVVTRDQMAVYMARALNLPTAAFEGFFSDVTTSQWAWPWIEALVRADVVQGYPGGIYRPAQNVNRGQMAVYVARGIYGALTVPSGPVVGHFSDVPDYDPGPAHPYYDFVEFTVAQHVVNGYPDGTYRPDANVTRDQMAVFVYKGFVQPTGSAVVLAGPAVTAVDIGTAGYDGWSSAAVGEAADPGTAYVGLDALRLDAGMAPLDVKFELRDAATPTEPATGDYTATVTLEADDITAAYDAAAASGNPYLYVTWGIPSGLAEGDYILVVSVGGDEIARQPAFTIGPIPEPPPLETAVIYPSSAQTARGGGTILSGSYSDLEADDDSYVVVQSDSGTGQCGAQWTLDTPWTEDEILKVQVDAVAMESVVDGSAVAIMTSGTAGETRYVVGIDTFPEADVEYSATWESANTAKIIDMFWTSATQHRTNQVDLIMCGCPDGMTGGDYTTSFELARMTLTRRP
jgi:hypothetical protein